MVTPNKMIITEESINKHGSVIQHGSVDKHGSVIQHAPKKTIITPYAFANTRGILLDTIVKPKGRCPCYESTSMDARCCGACYYCCPSKNKDKQCECCPSSFDIYWNSGYVQTDSGYGNDKEKNGICCWLCFPVKLPLFFTCLLGSVCNNCINWSRSTYELNYLF